MNLGKDVPAVLALLPERPEKERKKGYFGAQVEGWCLARRAEFTDPVDGWQILVDPQQRARGVPQERWTWLVSLSNLRPFGPLRGRRWRVTRRWRLHETSSLRSHEGLRGRQDAVDAMRPRRPAQAQRSHSR